MAAQDSGKGKYPSPEQQETPPYAIDFEYEPAEDAEAKLLQVYEFLLGLPEGPETCLEREEST